MTKHSASDYTEEQTERCERVLVTVLGDIGPWSDHVYLAGGLAPRYLISELPPDTLAHVGTTDVDLIISISVAGEEVGAYRTLYNNLKGAGFRQGPSDFQWRRRVDEHAVLVELLCETDQVGEGRIFKPKGDYGSRLGALNVAGAELASKDFLSVEVEAERLDGGGRSKVAVRVANLLPLVVLKIESFQDRHANKDAYDLIFILRNWLSGPRAAGEEAAKSAVAAKGVVSSALGLLAERFADPEQDGPNAYAQFLGTSGEDPHRLRLEAVAVVREFLGGFGRLNEASG